MLSRRVWRALFPVAVVVHFVTGRVLYGSWQNAAIITGLLVAFLGGLYLVRRMPPEDLHFKP